MERSGLPVITVMSEEEFKASKIRTHTIYYSILKFVDDKTNRVIIIDKLGPKKILKYLADCGDIKEEQKYGNTQSTRHSPYVFTPCYSDVL